MQNQFLLKDKVCVVTGAGKGIGREVAKLFYEQGARLALITRDSNDFSSLKKEVSLDEDKILLFQGDVSCEVSVKDFIVKTVDKFGCIDVLINNAGMRFRKKFLDTTTQDWQGVMANNLDSVYFFCREAGKHMVNKGCGKIVNIASIVGTLGLPDLSVYGASKGGMISLTKCLALEWASYNINVNVIAPGFCETSYTESFQKKNDLYQFTLDRTPQKKWGKSRDVANACLFLATDNSSYVTGEVLNVDGGWSAW
ncbi:MAG: glucose 1-dehydrogenase [Candidatus Omnitrophica bacterium]|nr:glucose 1-dehydrogenase [Candidatus Omnitrophota bacterium]